MRSQLFHAAGNGDGRAKESLRITCFGYNMSK